MPNSNYEGPWQVRIAGKLKDGFSSHRLVAICYHKPEAQIVADSHPEECEVKPYRFDYADMVQAFSHACEVDLGEAFSEMGSYIPARNLNEVIDELGVSGEDLGPDDLERLAEWEYENADAEVFMDRLSPHACAIRNIH